MIPLPDNKQRGKFKKAEWEALLVFLTKIIPTIWANNPILELNVLGKVQYHLLLVLGTWLFREFQSTSLLKAIRLVKHDFPILDPH